MFALLRKLSFLSGTPQPIEGKSLAVESVRPRTGKIVACIIGFFSYDK
jgi:hypothetical protein